MSYLFFLQPDITKCRVSLPQKTLDKHTPSHLRVCLFDEDGDPCSGSHNIDTKLTLLADNSIVAGTISKPEKNNPGEHVVSFTPTRAGDCDIQVTVNGTPLPSGPLRVMVNNHAEVCLCDNLLLGFKCYHFNACSLTSKTAMQLVVVLEKQKKTKKQSVKLSCWIAILIPVGWRMTLKLN